MVCEFCKWVDKFDFACPVCLLSSETKQSLLVHLTESHNEYLNHMDMDVECFDGNETICSRKRKLDKIEEVNEDARNSDEDNELNQVVR